MQSAKENISAVFKFNRYGLLTGIFLNSQNESDQAILMKGLNLVLRPQKNILKKIFKELDSGRN